MLDLMWFTKLNPVASDVVTMPHVDQCGGFVFIVLPESYRILQMDAKMRERTVHIEGSIHSGSRGAMGS
jgi:hypothetical protein